MTRLRQGRHVAVVRQPRAGDAGPAAAALVLQRAVAKVGELPTPVVLARRAVAESA